MIGSSVLIKIAFIFSETEKAHRFAICSILENKTFPFLRFCHMYVSFKMLSHVLSSSIKKILSNRFYQIANKSKDMEYSLESRENAHIELNVYYP